MNRAERAARRSSSPARSLSATHEEPPTSPLDKFELQVRYPLLEEREQKVRIERDELQQQLDSMREERNNLIEEKKRLEASKQEKGKLYSALKDTLGLVSQVLNFDAGISERVLTELPTPRPAWTVLVLGLGWACLSTLKFWLLVHLAQFLVESAATPCTACRLAGACGTDG
jgi:hypothetical protein